MEKEDGAFSSDVPNETQEYELEHRMTVTDDQYLSPQEIEARRVMKDAVQFGADSQDNIYLVFKNSIRVFEKNGKQIKRVVLNHPNIQVSQIAVDSSGYFCVYGERSQIFDDRALPVTLIDHPLGLSSRLEFVNGTLYGDYDGEIYYSKDGRKPTQRNFVKDISIENYPQEEAQYYLQPYQIELDKDNDVYITGSNPEYRLYKFAPDRRLLAYVPIAREDYCYYLNPQTGDVYTVFADKNDYVFSKWISQKNPVKNK
jgi:hypothetical protein